MDTLVFKMNLCMYSMTSHYNKTFYLSLLFLTVIILQLNMEHLLVRYGKEVNLICGGYCYKKDRLRGEKQHWICDLESGLLLALRTQFPKCYNQGMLLPPYQGYLVTCTRSGTNDRLQ